LRTDTTCGDRQYPKQDCIFLKYFLFIAAHKNKKDRRNMRVFLIIFLFLWLPATASAQMPMSREAHKLLSKGTSALLQKKYEKAEKYFKKSIKAAPYSVDAYSALADLYQNQNRYQDAASLLRQAANSCPKCANAFAVPLATALWRAQLFAQAEGVLNSWQKPAGLSKKAQWDYNLLRQNIQYGKYAMSLPPTDTPENMTFRINSVYDEYFPSISQDDSTIVFTRKTNGMDEDFYLAHRDSCGGWFIARPLGSPPNSSDQEGAQMISADNHYLFFMRCGNRSLNGWALGGCDLYFSYTDKDGWAQPVPFGATINTPAFEGMPSLSPDNKVLYFISDREGGYGGKDIWKSDFQNGLWQIPENLGPEINTQGDETAPWIASDNKTLYFTSNGHPGLGGNDIFYSKNDGQGHWKRPENLGYPINSSYDDVSLTLSKDGKKAYYASNRPGGMGGMDLYEVALPESLQPESQTWRYGIVKDSLTGERLPYAQMEWTDPETGKLISKYQSNHGDASFLSAFPLNKKLALRVIHFNYLDYADTLIFDTHFVSPPDTFNIALLPNYYQPPLMDTLICRIPFAKNDFALNDSLKIALVNLITPFLDKPHVSFIVNGFTDNSGTPDLNVDMSYRRARSVAEILFNLGIMESKISVQGWADASPAAPNDTEEGRQQNRRVELVVRLPEE
jgi:Tol biopolymer transport system component